MILISLATSHYADRHHFTPMDEAMLKQYAFFERLGFFGIKPDSAKGAAKLLRTARTILSQNNTTLWITAQGRFVDVRHRPVELKPGLAHLAHQMTHGRIIPIAIEYTFWNQSTPEALLAIGQPIDVKQLHETHDVHLWQNLLTSRLGDLMDELAQAASQRDEGLNILDPVPLGLTDLPITSRGPNEHQQDETLKSHVIAGDTHNARAMLLSMFMNGRTMESLCDGPLTQAMHEVGTCWLKDSNGIHIEHRSTDLCMELLMYMRTVLPNPPSTAPLALGAAPEHDLYTIPSLMATVVLQSLGWRTINLGSQLPVKSLISAVQKYQPTLVWLSVSVPKPWNN